MCHMFRSMRCLSYLTAKVVCSKPGSSLSCLFPYNVVLPCFAHFPTNKPLQLPDYEFTASPLLSTAPSFWVT